MKLTSPQVANLLARPRYWGWKHVRAGDFGDAVQATRLAGRPWLVDLTAVEAYAGHSFSPAQIAAAVNPESHTMTFLNLNRLFSMTRAKPGRIASLTQRLAEATTRVSQLESTFPRIAHDAALGAEDARASFHAVRAELDAARAEVVMLTNAIEHERTQQARNAAVMKRAEQQAIKDRVLKKAKRRAELAAELTGHLTVAIGVYKKMIALTHEICAAAPLHQPADGGMGLFAGEVRRMVDAEIIRLDNVPLVGPESVEVWFPREARPNTLDDRQVRPSIIQPLADALSAATAKLEREMNMRPVFPSPASSAGGSGGDVPAVTRHGAAGTEPQARHEIGNPTSSEIPAQAAESAIAAPNAALSALLENQNALSKDLTPEGEAAYRAVVDEIAAHTSHGGTP